MCPGGWGTPDRDMRVASEVKRPNAPARGEGSSVPGVENVSQPRYFGGLHRLPCACGIFREAWLVRVGMRWVCLGNEWANVSRLRPSHSVRMPAQAAS